MINKFVVKAMAQKAEEFQARAYELAMQETQPARRVSVFLNNSIAGEFKASELGKTLGVSAATVRKVATVQYGLKAQKGWFFWKGQSRNERA